MRRRRRRRRRDGRSPRRTRKRVRAEFITPSVRKYMIRTTHMRSSAYRPRGALTFCTVKQEVGCFRQPSKVCSLPSCLPLTMPLPLPPPPQLPLSLPTCPPFCYYFLSPCPILELLVMLPLLTALRYYSMSMLMLWLWLVKEFVVPPASGL